MFENLKKQLEKFSTIGLAGIAGVFWRMGGSGNYSRYWRRAGVAILLVLNCFIKTKSLFSLLVFPTSYFPFTLGYGLPSPDDPKPSVLGKFFYKLLKLNYLENKIEFERKLQEGRLRFLVRTICGLSYSLNYLVLGILKGNIIGTIIAMFLLTISTPLICSLKLKAETEEKLIGIVILGYTILI